VGVGDVGEMPGRHGISGRSSSGDDGRGEGRECNAGTLSGCIRAECDASPESSRHRIELSDSARVEHGAYELHRESSGGPYGMRVDRVGVRDLGEVSGGTWSSGHPASRDDGGRARREHHADMVV